MVETSRPGGDSANDGGGGGGAAAAGAGGGGENDVEGVEGGGSRLETQVDISLEQTRHLPTIRKTFTSSVPGGALLRRSAAMQALLRPTTGCVATLRPFSSRLASVSGSGDDDDGGGASRESY